MLNEYSVCHFMDGWYCGTVSSKTYRNPVLWLLLKANNHKENVRVENLPWHAYSAALVQSTVVTAQGNKEVFVWNILQSLVSIVTIIMNTFSFRNNICLLTDLKSQLLLK